jgi:hypothetical protein
MRQIRERTRDGEDLVNLALRVLHGEIPGTTIQHRLEALHWLADRGWGKPTVSVELTGVQESVAPTMALNIFQILANPDQARRLQDATVGAIGQAQESENRALPPASLTAR